MDTNVATAVTQAVSPSPPPPTPDGRATADAAATKSNPRPDVPTPTPSDASQTGLVTRAALSEKDAAPKLDTSGVSAAERTLKPYGITMLPDTGDTPKAADPEDSTASAPPAEGDDS
ncbi:MAG: hypothetical protein AAGL89_06955 [Pseudomonadota bacterium]